ncbi:WD domain G-beta repeat [Carpediemonas membranifera]|uniref:WD domain G-beta repeat n=1 Tax=Carpediemonas membranifera TaxID=201153 RepID=A0A8J6E0R1_9EUKA|nr:WD domain G-beta repeat [Carpediemonas membranifera]|eukprot:KAG9392543.1 WD domain G-beta repeat [Carpediemonas membranifera]
MKVVRKHDSILKDPKKSMIQNLCINFNNEIIAATFDNRINYYNLSDGSISHKYPISDGSADGIDRMTFINLPHYLLYTTTNQYDYGIRLLNAETHQVQRVFTGHQGRVTSLHQNPRSDTFITASDDNTVRIWDLRSEKPIMCIPTESGAVASFDTSGLVFAIAANSKIEMYPEKKAKPFQSGQVKDSTQVQFNHMTFSPTSNYLLLSASNGEIYMFKTLREFKQQAVFTGHQQADNVIHRPVFTRDESSVTIGDATGLSFYDINNPASAPVHVTSLVEQSPISCCVWHPSKALLISAGYTVDFWVPEI